MEVSMGRSSINGRCSWIFHSQVNCQRLVQHKLSYKAFFFTERKYTGGGQDSLPHTYSWNHQLVYSSSPYWIPHDTTHGLVTIPMMVKPPPPPGPPPPLVSAAHGGASNRCFCASRDKILMETIVLLGFQTPKRMLKNSIYSGL